MTNFLAKQLRFLIFLVIYHFFSVNLIRNFYPIDPALNSLNFFTRSP